MVKHMWAAKINFMSLDDMLVKYKDRVNEIGLRFLVFLMLFPCFAADGFGIEFHITLEPYDRATRFRRKQQLFS